MEKFFAFLNRMKYINRWALMRNTEKENLMEHSYMTAVVAHALATISNTYFDGNTDPDKIAVKALFHDTSEIFTGDMPTPVKYLNEEINSNYKKIEALAGQKILKMLPQQMQQSYAQTFDLSAPDSRFVKYADKLCAYIKCVEEIKFGNGEFKNAKQSILNQLKSYDSKEVEYFLTHFVEAFELTLDEYDL